MLEKARNFKLSSILKLLCLISKLKLRNIFQIYKVEDG